MSPDDPQPIIIHPALQGEVVEADARPLTTRGPERRAYVETVRDAEPSPAPPDLAAPSSKRAHSLDALRGLFLISMTLGFTISSPDLPLWMYHRQMPPPDETLVNVAGISWRDLAYGAFLFTMAAALPLTLTRRIERGETEIAIIVAAIRRYLLLLFFAILIAHSNTFFLGYTNATRLLAIGGFAIMAMVFTRRRPDWNEQRYRYITLAGWVLALAFLAFSPLLYGKRFSFERIDDIIAGLAFASLTGSLIWYFTRENLVARLAILAGAVALYLGAKQDGWVQDWWYSSAIPWAFAPNRLSLLTVVIPGTIAGDVILRWMRSSRAETTTDTQWKRGRVWALALLATAITPIVVVGMYNRAVQLTTQAVLALLVVGLFLTMRPATSTERVLRSLFLWGAVWLTIGLFLEPFEGGIKKAPETLTYFFTVTGTTTLLLVALTAFIDALGKQKWVNTLIDVGHNPLLTYVLFTVLINSVLELTPGLRESPGMSVGEAMLRSALETIAVVVIVRYGSRKRIFWRT